MSTIKRVHFSRPISTVFVVITHFGTWRHDAL